MTESNWIKNVGIALAAYQPQPEYFAEQLQSIANQSWRNWRCIITMDSSLASVRVIPALAEFFEDRRFTWIQNDERLGHVRNFAKAISLLAEDSEVDAIACADQDDVWLPRKLDCMVQELGHLAPMSLIHSDMNLVFGNELYHRTLWQHERRILRNVEPLHLAIRSLVNGAAMMFDANLIRKMRSVPAEVDAHDQWLAFLASLNGGVHPIYEPLVLYRQHSANLVGVTKFRGFFSLPGKPNAWRFKSLVSHCYGRLKETERILGAGQSLGLTVPSIGAAVLVRLVIRYCLTDPVLARAAAARLLGLWFRKLGICPRSTR